MTNYLQRLCDRWTEPFSLSTHLLMLARVGSHSHGTYIPSTDPNGLDDIDLMGVVLPPSQYWIGLDDYDNTTFKEDELDVVLYGLRKVVRLLLKGNPNVVGLLWLHPEDLLVTTPEWEQIREMRDIFSSKQVGEAFSGYAYDQLKRMTAFSTDRMDRYEELTAIAHAAGYTPEDIMRLTHTDLKRLINSTAYKIGEDLGWMREFRELHRKHFSGYMGEKRKQLVKQFSYDVKNACHAMRLLRMGREFMETGVLQVRRTTDADELRDIKRGLWSLERVQDEAQRELERFRESKANSPLPEEPNREAAGLLLQRIVRTVIT